MGLRWSLLQVLLFYCTLGYPTCSEPHQGKPCASCQEADLLQVLDGCVQGHPEGTPVFHLQHSPKPSLVFTPRPPNAFGLGNHLSQLFQGVGLAHIAGLSFEARPPLNVSGFVFRSSFPGPPSPNYNNTDRVRWFCDTRLPKLVKLGYYHTYPGAWLVANVQAEVQRAVCALADGRICCMFMGQCAVVCMSGRVCASLNGTSYILTSYCHVICTIGS